MDTPSCHVKPSSAIRTPNVNRNSDTIRKFKIRVIQTTKIIFKKFTGEFTLFVRIHTVAWTHLTTICNRKMCSMSGTHWPLGGSRYHCYHLILATHQLVKVIHTDTIHTSFQRNHKCDPVADNHSKFEAVAAGPPKLSNDLVFHYIERVCRAAKDNLVLKNWIQKKLTHIGRPQKQFTTGPQNS